MRFLAPILAFGTAAWGSLGAAQPPQLRIDGPATATSGTVTEVTARIEVTEGLVLAWSIGLAVEGLSVLDATTEGTDFERLSRDGFAEVHVAEGGSACATIGVLSFGETVSLPTGSSEVLRASALVARKDPGRARIFAWDGFEFPGNEAPLRNEVVTAGGSVAPLSGEATEIDVEGCAQLALFPLEAPSEERPVRLNLIRGESLSAEVGVIVATGAHLRPQGATFGLSHDPAILELETAEFLADFARLFIRADGFAVVQTSERGFAATFLSSASVPSSLPVGTQRILRASYVFIAEGAHGQVFTTALTFSDDLPIDQGTSTAVFQPGGALPCGPEHLSLEIEAIQPPWIRGDSNGDAEVDISDAIVILGHLFLGEPAPCVRAAEVDADGEIDLTDSIALLSHLFLGSEPPSSPFPECGRVPSAFPCDVTACE